MVQRLYIGESSTHRTAICAYLAQKRAEDPNFRVIDIGGSAASWSYPVVDAILDLNPATERLWFKANLNRYQDWEEVRASVREHGKFAYAICSHTLEDIANPMLALDLLPELATSGVILVPSKYREFSHIEGKHLGYLHHRWIFDAQDSVFVGYPKLGFLEHETELHRLGRTQESVAELMMEWAFDIQYRIVNDDYIGPSTDAVRGYYRALL